ncbi:MAG: MFS transporter [Saprospiraceae bacterium]|nr:MFS transporter [Saprospiraceae bacterium]HPG06136.1 MFS transporter [Saprospiraceae bacterium]
MQKSISNRPPSTGLSNYQKFIIAILAFLQFTVILDFMVLSPLGAILMDQLAIEPSRFGLVVSAYAFSAAISGLLTAGFADRFDRKKLLLFFYSGFMLGTLLCALAPNFHFLLIARIITGLFGGVINSIGFAIITDLFTLEYRGRVMGFVQMAFSASQVLGLPIGLVLANTYNWHAPFWFIGGIGIAVGAIIAVYMQPIREHLKEASPGSPTKHLFTTLTKPSYVQAYIATGLMTTGGFMLMPFASAFSVHNLGLTLEQLPLLYGVTGVFNIALGPLIGKWSDRYGKYLFFAIGTGISLTTILYYTHLGVSPLWLVIIVNVVLFLGITARRISGSALMTGVPAMTDRGAFMSVSSSIQQFSGGIASTIAGMIVLQQDNGPLQRYDVLGYVVSCTMVLVAILMGRIDREITGRRAAANPT